MNGTSDSSIASVCTILAVKYSKAATVAKTLIFDTCVDFILPEWNRPQHSVNILHFIPFRVCVEKILLGPVCKANELERSTRQLPGIL